MHYKTIALELLQLRPKLFDRLKQSRTLLSTVELYSNELRTSHEAWKDQLEQARPGSDPNQIASEAMELALKELEARLPPASPPDENETFSLDAAMAFIRRRHTPPA